MMLEKMKLRKFLFFYEKVWSNCVEIKKTKPLGLDLSFKDKFCFSRKKVYICSLFVERR